MCWSSDQVQRVSDPQDDAISRRSWGWTWLDAGVSWVSVFAPCKRGSLSEGWDRARTLHPIWWLASSFQDPQKRQTPDPAFFTTRWFFRFSGQRHRTNRKTHAQLANLNCVYTMRISDYTTSINDGKTAAIGNKTGRDGNAWYESVPASLHRYRAKKCPGESRLSVIGTFLQGAPPDAEWLRWNH